MQYEPLVMVIDDKEMFQYMAPILRSELETDNLVHFERVEDATALIHTGTRIDFIFSDWELADKRFITEVRNNPHTRNTPLVVLSQMDTDGMVAVATRAGATDILVKPFLEHALRNKITKIKHYLDHRRRHRVRLHEHFSVTATLGGREGVELELLDISIEGCRVRTTLEIYPLVPIYSSGSLQMHYGDETIHVDGEVLRVEHDIGDHDTGDTVLVTFEFTDAFKEDYDRLKEVIDRYWAVEQGEPG